MEGNLLLPLSPWHHSGYPTTTAATLHADGAFIIMTGAPLLDPFENGVAIPRYDFDFSVYLRDVLDEDFQLEEFGVIDIFHETRVRRLRGLRREVKKEEGQPSNSRGTALVSSRRIVEPFDWVSHVQTSISNDSAKVRQFY